MQWQIFAPIFLLQLINLFWYFLILRILVRYAFLFSYAGEARTAEQTVQGNLCGRGQGRSVRRRRRRGRGRGDDVRQGQGQGRQGAVAVRPAMLLVERVHVVLIPNPLHAYMQTMLISPACCSMPIIGMRRWASRDRPAGIWPPRCRRARHTLMPCFVPPAPVNHMKPKPDRSAGPG